MSGNSPIKLVAIIAVIFVVVVVGFVAIPRIGNIGNDYDEEYITSSTYIETTRGSNSGSLSIGSGDSENTKESDSNIETTPQKVTESTVEKTTIQNKATTRTNTSENTVKTTTKKSSPQIKSLEIISKPSKTEYYIEDSFSVSGLKAKVRYSDGSSKDVTSSVNIMTPDMSRSGNQNVKISYTENNKKVETSFTITIKTPSLTLSSDEEVLSVGQYLHLSANTNPSNCSVSWSSSDNTVATVSSSGKVSALNEGIVVITASFRYGNSTYSETCIISVKSNKPATSSLEVFFDDGYYENDEYTLYLYELEGTISSNYNIEYVEIGIIGPVYVNGTLQEIDQSQTYKYVYELETTSITLEELAELYGDGFEFDIVAGEEYLVYVYAEDSSGETDLDYYEMVFTVD